MQRQGHYTNSFIEGGREPLPVAVRHGLLVLVIFFHVGGVWALTQFEPAKLIVGDIAPMEVRMVSAEQPAQAEAPQLELSPDPPLPEPPPPPEVPLAEPPPPPEVPITDLASVVDPPPPDLPPPAFPVEAKSPPPPPPEPPKPEQPKPRPPPPKQAQKPPVAPAAPVEAAPQQQAAPAVAAAPKTVEASQLGFLVQPKPVYPARSRKAGEEGVVMVRMLIDIAGQPSQVSVQTSSGHTALDEAAVSAVRASQPKPYVERGIAQAVWVLVPIRFVLQ